MATATEGEVSTKKMKLSEGDGDPRFLNMTPHDIHVYRKNNGGSDGPLVEQVLVHVFPASGNTCRCVQSPVEPCDPISISKNSIPVIQAPSFSSVEGLPEKEEGLPSPDILVSMPVGEILRKEPETYEGAVYGPDTGSDGVLRDDKGVIKGTFRLVLYKPRSSSS